MDKQMMTGSIFIDHWKAFDLVEHQCLLHKLEHYGIRGKSLKWFEDYLNTRSRKVKYNQDESFSLAIGYGVPQGPDTDDTNTDPYWARYCLWYTSMIYHSVYWNLQ